MKRSEMQEIVAAEPSRIHIEVAKVGDELEATVDGKTYRASNPFMLDSLLYESGVPGPRNLYLITEED